ncbi:MAG: sodium:solute symporter family protein [Thermoguttaceae bacterium]|jgi:Na+/proline symporter|nr:sodium:solute symporter family protein [Thermoguttaceae bacterium]
MLLDWIDWTIVGAFLLVTLVIGLAVMKRAGSSSAEFFLSGRGMPWWLLGMSMVATTFSAGTPNFVTDIVRQKGIAGNWIWWSFLLTGMMTVFVYAKLWRRSGVMTDIEFYELRYSGKPAAFLRGFRAVYLGVLFNVVVMASAMLAVIKVAGTMLGASPLETILVAGTVTVAYSMMGGLTGVLLTDFLQFSVAMLGAIAAAVYLVNLDAVGGMGALLAHEQVSPKLAMFPDVRNTDLLLAVFVIPLTIQWWSVWYPGSEPGGGGYVAQRMLAAKNEAHATGATLLFNVAHYALRPWPWIVVALCSIIVFPTIESLQAAFPKMDPRVVQHDLAYPAMLTLLPSGLRGLMLASLMAAFMSTLSTHLNWGASYAVNDFYRRFIRPEASERELVAAGRLCTLLTMILAALLGLCLSNALQAFQIILQIGAGTGLLFILRWFWWRINAFSELAAMICSFVMAVGLEYYMPSETEAWVKMVIGVAVTTAAWIGVTLLTRPSDEATLRSFCARIRPGGPGWRAVVQRAEAAGAPIAGASQPWGVPFEILCMVVGCVVVYSALFATGYWLYGRLLPAVVFTAIAVVSSVLLIAMWKRANEAHDAQ